jgi:arsenate reductase
MAKIIEPVTVLFLCTGNSCRSQIAEGWTRHFHPDVIDGYSAGIEAHGLNPNAVRVMAEAGVDISTQSSQSIDELDHVDIDVVIAVCDHAHDHCPRFPGNVRTIRRSFDDPPRLAKEAGSDDEALDCYRRVRDEIRDYVEHLPEVLKDLIPTS